MRATAADVVVVQARLGRQKYPELFNPGPREQGPAILAELERQSVAETSTWVGYWRGWSSVGPVAAGGHDPAWPDPHGIAALDAYDATGPAADEADRQVRAVVVELVRHQLVAASRCPTRR